jgi:hypothetical protein
MDMVEGGLENRRAGVRPGGSNPSSSVPQVPWITTNNYPLTINKAFS